ncbi:MAG: hypothetical protein HUU20_27925 [Pirellulales bacterium]|nr:hypothetical protein [Pirellulales bacterium]
MNLEEARDIVLHLLSTEGRVTNSRIEDALGGDAGLVRRIREALILEDLADDYKNVGLIYTGPPDSATASHEPGEVPRPTAPEPNRLSDAGAEGETFRSRRIFLSYGHDRHTADALRIKADLEARRHQVWFDVERLEERRDWERQKGSELFVLTQFVINSSHPFSLPFSFRALPGGGILLGGRLGRACGTVASA